MASSCDKGHLDDFFSDFSIKGAFAISRSSFMSLSRLCLSLAPFSLISTLSLGIYWPLRSPQLSIQTLIISLQIPNPPLQLLNSSSSQLMFTDSIFTSYISSFAGAALGLDFVAADFATVTSVACV